MRLKDIKTNVKKILNSQKPSRAFFKKAKEFREEFDMPIFLQSNAEVVNEEIFWEFVSFLVGKKVDKKSLFELEMPKTRQEAVNNFGNSKYVYNEVFNKALVLKIKGEDFIRTYNKIPKIENKKWLVVENGENLFKIDENVVYVGGYPNKLTQEFLKDKEIEIFFDFDIEGMNIAESMKAKRKSLFIPDNLEELIKNGNKDLYEKQRKNLRSNYSFTKDVIRLIKKYGRCYEQEGIEFEDKGFFKT